MIILAKIPKDAIIMPDSFGFVFKSIIWRRTDGFSVNQG